MTGSKFFNEPSALFDNILLHLADRKVCYNASLGVKRQRVDRKVDLSCLGYFVVRNPNFREEGVLKKVIQWLALIWIELEH